MSASPPAKVEVPVPEMVSVLAASPEAERPLVIVDVPTPVTDRRAMVVDAKVEVAETTSVVAANVVEVALVEVALVNTAVEGVVAPMGELLMVPPSMVRSFATRLSASVPVNEGAKVKVPPELVTERRMLVSEEVAIVSAPV